MAVRSFLALGSNLGDRLENLQAAVRALGEDAATRILRSSRVYETDPVGPPQPDYLNAVVEVETTLGPRGLLDRCLAVERALGRVRGERWGPRVIDVDLLSYADAEIEEPDLQVPHPRMHERGFVLVPLLELCGDPFLPGGRRVEDLRTQQGILAGVRLFAPALRTRPATR